MKRVLVVGGGYAGVSAATALAEQGVETTLLETHSHLGGRVYSIPPSESFPAVCDNGPHLFLGAYQETWKLFQRLGVKDDFHWVSPLEIIWMTQGGVPASFKCAQAPPPFHLILGFLRSGAFPFREKISLSLALRRFSRPDFSLPPGVQTLTQYLDHERQGPISRERFWGPLCRAIMNLQPEEAAMAEFGETLHRSFFGSKSDSALAFPAKPLGEIAFPQVEGYLREKGGSLFLGEGARQLRLASGPFEVVTASGKVLSGDALILALPARSLESLWATSDLTPPLSSERMGHSPILSVNFILDRNVMEGHWMGLPGARFEWVFNRNANWGYSGPGQYLSMVSSADRELALLPVKELVVLALEELQRHFPQARLVSLLNSKVVKEMAATFRLTPENAALRPPCATAFPDVFLAGDFTATGLPATIESACLSGHRAASLALTHLGQGQGSDHP